ncbi:hypothetical protein ACUXJ1_002278 [Staphylococcus epidermidis]|nr:hypothetical protein [Staphylococcus epidermidis]
MKLAWNTQKNKMSDVKGKEMEQERKGRIKSKAHVYRKIVW